MTDPTMNDALHYLNIFHLKEMEQKKCDLHRHSLHAYYKKNKKNTITCFTIHLKCKHVRT